jgi:hypothetical protein
VSKTVFGGLLGTEDQLGITDFLSSYLVAHVIIIYFILIITPSVRQYRIRWDGDAFMLNEAEAAVGLYLYKPHRDAFKARAISSNKENIKAYLYCLQ